MFKAGRFIEQVLDFIEHSPDSDIADAMFALLDEFETAVPELATIEDLIEENLETTAAHVDFQDRLLEMALQQDPIHPVFIANLCAQMIETIAENPFFKSQFSYALYVLGSLIYRKEIDASDTDFPEEPLKSPLEEACYLWHYALGLNPNNEGALAMLLIAQETKQFVLDLSGYDIPETNLLRAKRKILRDEDISQKAILDIDLAKLIVSKKTTALATDFDDGVIPDKPTAQARKLCFQALRYDYNNTEALLLLISLIENSLLNHEEKEAFRELLDYEFRHIEFKAQIASLYLRILKHENNNQEAYLGLAKIIATGTTISFWEMLSKDKKWEELESKEMSKEEQAFWLCRQVLERNPNNQDAVSLIEKIQQSLKSPKSSAMSSPRRTSSPPALSSPSFSLSPLRIFKVPEDLVLSVSIDNEHSTVDSFTKASEYDDEMKQPNAEIFSPRRNTY